MQARYYDPVIGRFYSNDPVGFTAKNPVMSFNRYLYVNNNPYKYTDPNGEFLTLISGAIGAYTAYNQAKELGLSNTEAMIAGGFGALVGTLSGGAGSQVASGLIKQAASKLASNTTSKALKETGKSFAAGASSAGVTQVTSDAVGDLMSGEAVDIDVPKAIGKTIEGGITAATATVMTVSAAGKSVLAEVAESTVAIGIQESRRNDD